MIYKFLNIFIVFTLSLPLSIFAKSDTEYKIENLTNKILKEEEYYDSLDIQIKESSIKIDKTKNALNTIYKNKESLEKDLFNLQTEQKKIESHIISYLIKKYSKSIAIKHTNQKSLKNIINNKIYEVFESSIQNELVRYTENETLINEKLSTNKKVLTNLNNIKKIQDELILKNEQMKIMQSKGIKKLRQEYIHHIEKLKKINNI